VDGEVAYARFFDITIVDAQGQEIQPAEPVVVTIELADAPEEADQATVVHFDGDGGKLEKGVDKRSLCDYHDLQEATALPVFLHGKRRCFFFYSENST
jgi:hypothetical protein